MTNTRGVVSEVRFTRGPHTGTSDPVSSPLFSISHNPSDRSSVPVGLQPLVIFTGNLNGFFVESGVTYGWESELFVYP